MKTLFLMFIASFVIIGSALASDGDNKAVTFAQLPQKAQQFINLHFKDTKITYAQQDMGWLDGDYEVMFIDGRKVEFRKDGGCKEIECKRSEVPAATIPTAIQLFVNEKHATDKIIKIEFKSRGYEIKLASGLEVNFNSKYQFISYDN